NESEHPMKSIAVKGLPSSRFIEQQDARMFSSHSSREGTSGPLVAGARGAGGLARQLRPLGGLAAVRWKSPSITCRFPCRIGRPIIRRLFEDKDFSVTRVGDRRQFPTLSAKII